MNVLDNAYGEPENVLPAGESPRKARKWPYGGELETELFTDGVARFKGWERPAGRHLPGWDLCVPGTITLEGNYHRSMLKAVLVLACHKGLSQSLFSGPLRYLRGDNDKLWAMEPSILGVPSQGMFARVWLIAPPADEIRALYGVVVYGPMANIYTLCRDVQFGDPFAWELRAYQKEVRVYAGVSKYMRWRDWLLGELRPDLSDRRIGMYGVYAVRESRSLAGKPLAGFRATPDRRIIVLFGMIVSVIRFKNPQLHRQSSLRKRRLGENRGFRPSF